MTEEKKILIVGGESPLDKALKAMEKLAVQPSICEVEGCKKHRAHGDTLCEQHSKEYVENLQNQFSKIDIAQAKADDYKEVGEWIRRTRERIFHREGLEYADYELWFDESQYHEFCEGVDSLLRGEKP